MIRGNVVVTLGVTLASCLSLACSKEPGQPGSDLPVSRTTVTSVVQRQTTMRALPPPPKPAPVAAPAPEPAAEPASPTSTGVIVSDDVLRACNISPDDARNSPRFDFNSANLRSRGEDILTKVADCVKDGRLGKSRLEIVGYTDPRGSAQYNMKLGRDRANAAKGYLTRLGVPDNRVTTKSRGKEEATGTDEASWALDRRVEVHLAGGDDTRTNRDQR